MAATDGTIARGSQGAGALGPNGRLWLVASAVLLAACALRLASAGLEEEPLRSVIRWTARSSLLAFGLAFAASSLHRRLRSPATAWLLRHRRGLGLTFASSHTLHAAAILAAAWRSDAFRSEIDGLTIVLGGVVGYGAIFAMAASSNDAAVRALGRDRWRRLHLFGSYYLWILFFQSYAGRLVFAGQLWAALPVALLVLAMWLRHAPQRRPVRAPA